MTLSLDDVAARVGIANPKDAERQLVTMIEEGCIFARISQKDGNFKSFAKNQLFVSDFCWRSSKGAVRQDPFQASR